MLAPNVDAFQPLAEFKASSTPSLRRTLALIRPHLFEPTPRGFRTSILPNIRDGTGALDFPALFGALDKVGCAGAVGLEYILSGAAVDGLGWRAGFFGSRTESGTKAF